MAYLAFFLILGVQPTTPRVSISAKADTRLPTVSAALPADVAAKLPAGKLTQEQGEAHLRLTLVTGDKEGAAILGNYERRGQELVFVPRFPLAPEKQYRARLLLADGKALTAEYRVPAPAAGPPAHVAKVYPTGDVLPANHLRFVIYFSRPMRGTRDIFKQIRLVDDKGQTLDDTWLTDELWSEDGKMLILYIHPGRIKWGVILRLLLGPVLYPDRDYTLVIPADMLDADGRRLGKDYVKKFRTIAEDRARIELKEWKLTSPTAGSNDALVVKFPKAIDHLSLEKYLTITDAKGQGIVGKITIGEREKSWRFTPAQPWRGEEYKLRIDGRLEDTSGNTPLRAFDVDQDAAAPAPQPLERRFRPK